MEEFLRNRGVNLEKLEEDHIDATVVALLDDSQLAKYIPKFGDRVALREYLQSSSDPQFADESHQKKVGLMDRLRRKLSSAKREQVHKDDNTESSDKKARCTNAVRNKVRIEVGWMHHDDKSGSYKQVRSRNGGGTRNLCIEKNAMKQDILKEAKAVFFPGGMSPKGLLTVMECDLTDFKLDSVDDDLSVSNIISKAKMYKMRFYLATKLEVNTTDSDTGDVLPDLKYWKTSTPASSSESRNPEGPMATTAQNHSTLDSDRNQPSEPSTMKVTEEAGHQEAEARAVQPNPVPNNAHLMKDQDVDTSYAEILAMNSTSKKVDIDLESILSEDTLARAMREWSDDVQFGPVSGTDITMDETIPYEHNASVQQLHVHRGHVLEELIKEASADTFTTDVKYEMKMIASNGVEETAEDNGGVLRDALTEFWESFFMKYCIGTTVKVPVIRHDMSASAWKAIAKVIVVGWNQENMFPIQLAKPFMQQCMFGCVDSTCNLMDSFLQYIPCMDRSVITQALENFIEDDDLLDILERLKVKQRVTQDSIRRILEEVSHRELVQAPMFICDAWYGIMVQLKLDHGQLDQLYRDLAPTNRKVLKALTFPEQLTKPEMELKDYISNLVRELDPEMLKLFLRFCTGSALMVKQHITVRFTASDFTESVRCPTSHTCGCILEIPRTYANDSYVVFKSDFNSILQSRYWQMDVV